MVGSHRRRKIIDGPTPSAVLFGGLNRAKGDFPSRKPLCFANIRFDGSGLTFISM